MRYSTTKEVVVKSFSLRIVKLIAQLVVAAYLGWVLYYQSGYQSQHIGFGFTQVSTYGNAISQQPDGSQVIWDSVDTVVPSKEREALFLVTNYILTPNQTRSICVGTDSKTEKCNNGTCPFMVSTLNGYTTGECNSNTGYCYVNAWCPLEVDATRNTTVLSQVKNFNITVKNYAHWNDLKITKTNDLESGKLETGVNSFNLADIVAQTNYTFEEVATAGAAITMIIRWNCDFDQNENKCKPQFQYLRLDNPNSFSTGFNYRYVNKYRKDNGGAIYRDQYKIYGICLVFITSAIGKKFDVARTVISIGSTAGMLAISNFIADKICMWLIPNAGFYRNKKYMNVDEQKKEEKKQLWKDVLSPEELNAAYF